MTTDNSPDLGKIGQIAIAVTDLKKSTDFYRETLGIPFMFDAGEMSFFNCDGIRLMLGVAPEADMPASGTVIYFTVADIHNAYETLRERGVEFVEDPHLVARMPEHELWMAFFKDPDGHTLALMSEIKSVQK